MEKYLEQLIELSIQYAPKLAGAIILLILGLWLIGVLTRALQKLMLKSKLDDSLVPFFKSLLNITLKLLLLISVLSMIGIQMTSFIAILGAAGLAIGMALSGTLQNFAGGVIILVFKPYRVGDYIEAQGYSGTVKAIMIFNTHLNTPDNKLIIIPNGPLSSGSLINYSAMEIRRIDWTFGIAYGDDSDKAKAVLLEILHTDRRVLKDPAPFAAIGALADSSVNFTTRAWVKAEDYWDVFFETNEKVYKTFDKENLSIPFPQMDVHVKGGLS